MRGWGAISLVGVVCCVASAARAQDGGAPIDAGVAQGDAGVAQGDAGVPAVDAGAEPATDAGGLAPPPPPPATEQPPPPAPPPAGPPAQAPAQPRAVDYEAPPPPPVPRRMPLSYAARPLTLPARMARIDAVFSVTSVDPVGALERESFVSFLGTVGFGITDDAELGVIALPIQLSPELRFGPPGVYGLFRFVRGTVEAGVHVEGRFPLMEDDSATATVAVPVLVRLSEVVRLDTGLAFHAGFTDPFNSRLSFPLTLTIQTTESFFVGARSGLDVYHFHDGFGDGRRGNSFIPAGIFLGGTLRSSRGPAGDLRLGWLLPSVTDGTDHWVFGFGGSFFIY